MGNEPIHSHVNALSIDVEDYHSIVSRWWFGQGDAMPGSSVVRNTDHFLEQLAVAGVKATFFVLGEVAEVYPDLIRRMAREGHELGVHGYKHLWVHTLSPAVFRSEVDRAKKLIEDISGQAVLGHRAPAFSLKLGMTWAFNVLLDVGFVYDSSIYPIKGKRYGDISAGLDPFPVRIEGRSLWEIPLAALECCGRRWPVAGGGYLRHFPYCVNCWALRRINRRRPAVVYMHPYEIETSEPRTGDAHWPLRKRIGYRKFSLLQYRNRSGMRDKLKRLLADFKFSTVAEVYRDLLKG